MTSTVGELVADPSLGDPILDNAAWASLTGPHRQFGEVLGLAARYHPDFAPFVAIADEQDPQAWADLAQLVGAGATVVLSGLNLRPPADWAVAGGGGGVQMVDVSLRADPDPETEVLGPRDVPEILALIERTQPGPFRPRTVELGTYLGIRREGKLVAMAGERLHPPGWTEISAVCTDAGFRGQGLASRLVRAVAHNIIERGDRALLHASAANENAIRLYDSLGLKLRRRNEFQAYQVPQG